MTQYQVAVIIASQDEQYVTELLGQPTHFTNNRRKTELNYFYKSPLTAFRALQAINNLPNIKIYCSENNIDAHFFTNHFVRR